MTVCESSRLILLWVGFLNLAFVFDGGSILTFDWEKLESRNFVITYNTIYPFKLYKNIFADISISQMNS